MGCAARKVKPQLPDIEVPPQAVEQLRLIDCDVRVNPPVCRTMQLKFDDRKSIIHYKIIPTVPKN